MEARGNLDLSRWGTDAASKYAAAKHGPDGARFLDPHVYAAMSREQLEGMDVLDLGAGTGPWTKHALEQGAGTVTGLELNPAMLAKARELLSKEGTLSANVRLVEGNVGALPLDPESFDRLASINVGCNLPEGTFEAHFREALRVARPGARFVVTAPDSLTVPFTNGTEVVDIQKEVDGRWGLQSERTPQAAKSVIASLGSVLRATFVLDASGKPVLVTEGNKDLVRSGTPIVRRIPGLAVDNNFHTAEEYMEAAERAGWAIASTHQDTFGSEEARGAYNETAESGKQLGPEYVANPAFLVMNLEHRA